MLRKTKGKKNVVALSLMVHNQKGNQQLNRVIAPKEKLESFLSFFNFYRISLCLPMMFMHIKVIKALFRRYFPLKKKIKIKFEL